ncbi:MAG: hypothetical protein WCX65_08200 [bacterium]
MDKQTDQSKLNKSKASEPKPKRAGSRKTAWVAAAVIAAAALVVIYFIFLSPTALFKRSFNGAVSAFEHKNSEDLSKFISDDYVDAGGNIKPVMLAASMAFFSSYDTIYLRIKRLDIKIINGEKAELTIEGSVYFKTGDETYRYKTEKPVVIYMAKETDGRRRLTSIQGLTFELESVANDLEDLK